MEVRPGQLVVISGPSGVGKTSLLRKLLATFPALVPSVSATTRPARAGERDGVDYHFLTAAEFERRRRAGAFLECCQVYGRRHWYGTLVDEVAPRLAAGKWVVLEIDVEGTLSILQKFPAAITIFVAPSRPDQLLERLRGRGTESAEAMARRLEVAQRELLEAHRYRHRVVNENLDDAVSEVAGVLAAAGFGPAACGMNTASKPPTERGVSA
ncbi:MAG: guanylate kinase [Planctomycetes bacterium]|nr:guanylate kinase [Planctomycetota bacterium]